MYGISTGLVHVKAIAVFIMHVKNLVETLLSNMRRGKLQLVILLTFPQTSGKCSLHLIQTSDYCVNKIWHGLHHRFGNR